jgi:hypothetical protein
VQYFCLLVSVLALELTAGAVVFAHRAQLGSALEGELRAGLRAAGNMSDDNLVATTWHGLHRTFQVGCVY